MQDEILDMLKMLWTVSYMEWQLQKLFASFSKSKLFRV